MSSAKLTKEEIKHIAKLAKLEFSDEELEKFDDQFNDILGYVSMINECDTTGIEFEHNLQDYNGKVLQDDEARNGLTTQEALQNATDGRSKNQFIVTSKIVSKE